MLEHLFFEKHCFPEKFTWIAFSQKVYILNISIKVTEIEMDFVVIKKIL